LDETIFLARVEQMTKAKNGNQSGDWRSSRNHLLTVLIVLLLSLGSWTFFHFESMPLTNAQTTFVVLVWLILVLLVKGIWSRFTKAKKKGAVG
jgi:hypothetical protein